MSTYYLIKELFASLLKSWNTDECFNGFFTNEAEEFNQQIQRLQVQSGT